MNIKMRVSYSGAEAHLVLAELHLHDKAPLLSLSNAV